MTVAYNITAYQKTTFKVKFIWKDNAGEPQDLSAYSGAMHVRQYEAASGLDYLKDPVIEATTDNGKVIFDTPTAEVRIFLRPDDMDLPAGLYRYDILLTETTGGVADNVRLVEGDFTIKKAVTEL